MKAKWQNRVVGRALASNPEEDSSEGGRSRSVAQRVLGFFVPGRSCFNIPNQERRGGSPYLSIQCFM